MKEGHKEMTLENGSDKWVGCGWGG